MIGKGSQRLPRFKIVKWDLKKIDVHQGWLNAALEPRSEVYQKKFYRCFQNTLFYPTLIFMECYQINSIVSISTILIKAYFTYGQGWPMDRPPGGSRGGGKLGGSSGSTKNTTSKKISFLYHSDHSE